MIIMERPNLTNEVIVDLVTRALDRRAPRGQSA